MMMVQMMMKLTLSKFFPSLRTGSLSLLVSFFGPPIPPSVQRGRGEDEELDKGRRLPVFATVSSTHLYAAHPTIKPHMPPVFVCVLTMPLLLSCVKFNTH